MPCYRKGRASKCRGAAARASERRFADGVKTMVSGEANFAVKMSFQASFIGRNDYVAYPPQWRDPAENISRVQKIKFRQKMLKKRQRRASFHQMKR